jgi:hypothetical protein
MTKWALPFSVLLHLAAVTRPFAAPYPVPATSMDELVASAERTEYHFRATDASPRIVSAPNRTQGLRVQVTSSGVRFSPRAVSPSWFVRLQLEAFGRPSALTPLSEGFVNAVYSRAEIDRAVLSEWYVNEATGIEHGLVIPRRPIDRKGEPLLIQFALETLLTPILSKDERSIDFRDGGANPAMRYARLEVFDSRGRRLDARLALPAPGMMQMIVDDGSAVYPLLVDPVTTSPAWTAESNQADARLGTSVATAGDVNGDGFSDVLVAAPRFDNGQTDEGKVFLHLGSETGLDPNAAWSAESDQASALFGTSVGPAGDVNGDGYDDFIVGAPFYDNSETDEGRAFVYLGSSTGPGSSASWTAEPNQTSAQSGTSVGTAGDVNGDGYADVIVGGPLYDGTLVNEGRAWVYHGSSSGLSSSAAWVGDVNIQRAQFGASVSTAGDVNGDGYDDVIVGAPRAGHLTTEKGKAFVFLGSSSGLSSSPIWTFEDPQSAARFGTAVANAGDVNGDGYADVIVGAPDYTVGPPEDNQTHPQAGKFYVFHGTSTGIEGGDAHFSFSYPDAPGARVGATVATAGDVNGDGYADVLVGGPTYSVGGTSGVAGVFFGGANGSRIYPALDIFGSSSGNLGVSVSTAGDVNGDGYSDFVIGENLYDNGETDEGRALAYHGSAQPLYVGTGTQFSARWSIEGDESSGHYGQALAMAGDFNGDGYSDVLVGSAEMGEDDTGIVDMYLGSTLSPSAPSIRITGLQNSGFGKSVASAGDTKGDGYSDIIIAAPLHQADPNDPVGAAFVFFGSDIPSSELTYADANWTVLGAVDTVAGAGDVNGDGYGDVLIADTGTEVKLFTGSPSGLSETPSAVLSSTQTGSLFGYSVASAGDVNGDGYSDVIVGVPGYDGGQTDEGRAYLYLGSSSGLSTSAAWYKEPDEAGAQFGSSVSTAGDVNGDGYSDVIVGAPFADAGGTNRGAAYVYLGSSSGLAASPLVVLTGGGDSDFLGGSVASAGDVNGDSFSDIVVGVTGFGDDGMVRIYTGPDLDPNAVQSTQGGATDEGLGSVVTGGGDINGDGFGDVLASATEHDAGVEGSISKAGQLSAYYGNLVGGPPRLVRQHQTDDTGPLHLLGVLNGTDMTFKALGRSPAGRTKVRIQWEIEVFGDAFDGVSIEQGTLTQTAAPSSGVGSVVALSEKSQTLDDSKVYHWRLRIASRNPYFPRSPWMCLPYNSATEVDFLVP